MYLGEIVTGQRNKWDLIRKLGEGDAGEVYLVESLLERKQAILKRPRRTTFSSDALRQASQIELEGKILKSLEGLNLDLTTNLHVPVRFDQSSPESGFGEAFFIVIERASGIDLNTMARAARFEVGFQSEDSSPAIYGRFLDRLTSEGKLPEPVLIKVMAALLDLFEKIHFSEMSDEGVKHFGVVWNDVKPGHLYWDLTNKTLTVIDWGNAQFLQADGVSQDRQHSCNDDYFQFMLEMGRFLSEVNPDLYSRLRWPDEILPGTAFSDGVKPLKQKLAALLAEVLEELRSIRSQETELIIAGAPNFEQLGRLENIQNQILDHGAWPDYQAESNYLTRLGLKLASERNMIEFRQVCARNQHLGVNSAEKWQVLMNLVDIAEQSDATIQEAIYQILDAGVANEWPYVLWELLSAFRDQPLPSWWDDICQPIRQLQLNLDHDSLPPYMALNRLYYTLQFDILNLSNSKNLNTTLESDEGDNLLKFVNDEVVKKWKQIEPDPPNSGVEYKDVDIFSEQIDEFLPGTKEHLDKVLDQPRAHAELVMDAWSRKDFEAARRGLRGMLLWDPHRRRLLQADKAILRAAQWLTKVRLGASKAEPFYDFLTEAELEGRELQNQVGFAPWLDAILKAMRMLRQGVRPVDLVMQYPEVNNELPWLYEYRSRETISLPRSRPLQPDQDVNVPPLLKTVSGVKESNFGPGEDLYLGAALDNWVPEARGSSARVFAVSIDTLAGQRSDFAIKIMRPDRIDYSLPLFREEVQILSLLRDVPGVTPMLECGFLKADASAEVLTDTYQKAAIDLRGEMIRFGEGEAQNFLASMDKNIDLGWLPYLVLAKKDHAHNLMVFCDAGHTRGSFLPLRESLYLAVQICDIMQTIHDRNIAYRDHKILHYYWDVPDQRVAMIDWNIAQRHPQGLSEAERQFDLVQFAARALHHILTGRPAQGALPLGPNRPEEIEQASSSYPVQWTYDDERLPNRVKEILEQALNQGYTKFGPLRKDLNDLYQHIPDQPI
ncbi:MAG TPA: serine/threonine-protein kinase [Anaerolineales bacterium]